MPSSDGDGSKDSAVAKMAGFVAFSGIALSIIKALISKPPHQQDHQQQFEVKPSPLSSKKPLVEEHAASGSSSSSVRTVEIVKGDTLWGLSKKYGVTIDVIKEANGITGDTIYAGKKLIIP